MVTIEDGTGTGNKAKVDDVNRLKVYSTIETQGAFHSDMDASMYSWTNVTYNYDALDTILLVKNTATEDLAIARVYISGDTVTEVIIHCPTCTVPTGTAVTGVNFNRKSSLLAEATAIADETTNTQANVIWRGRVAANTMYEIDFNNAVILGLNNCIAVDYVTDGAAANVVIHGFFHVEH